MIVHSDCRQFRGDRPCLPHKREGVHCDGCPHYDPIRERILVIKLDAVGDVLRTTCILPGLQAKHPSARIDWLTREEAAPLFDNNPAVDRVIAYPGDAVAELLSSEYDIVINLDAAALSARLATSARGRRRIGYGFDPAGFVFPWNEEAREWFEMGLFDDVKKANARTYQEIVLAICGLSGSAGTIALHLSDEERRRARDFAAARGIVAGGIVVGLNTGAGSRWTHKKWTEEGFVELIRLLREGTGKEAPAIQILLLGGPGERERNRRIAGRGGTGAIDGGVEHPLRDFMAIVDLCDLVVTGDTMALHVAAALGKKVVALFGPTSAAEIDLYGRGKKIVSPVPCAGCYMPDCSVSPTCMESITAKDVYSTILELL